MDIRYEVDYDNDKQNKIEQFVAFAAKELGLEHTPDVIIQDGKKNLSTTAQYLYSQDEQTIVVNGKDRMLVDVLRSIAHEMTHHQQFELGKLKKKPKDIGGDIEDEANSLAGQLIKKFAQSEPENTMIYEQVQKSGNLQQGIEKMIAVWEKRGSVNINDLKIFNLEKLQHDATGQEIFIKTVNEALLNAMMEGRIILEQKVTLNNEHISALFVQSYCEDLSSIIEWAMEGKLYLEEDLHEYAPFNWHEYMFKDITRENFKLIRKYGRLKTITNSLLEQEFPDLLKRFADVYYESILIGKNKAAHDFFEKRILQVLKGCNPVIVYGYGVQITASTEFYKQSEKRFREMMGTAICNALICLLDDLIYARENGLMGAFMDLQEGGYGNFDEHFFEDINGLPKVDCRQLQSLSSGIDKTYFNQQINEIIMKFFDRYD